MAIRQYIIIIFILLIPMISEAQSVGWGSATQFDEGANAYIQIEEINTDKYAICYSDDQAGICEVHSVDGTTPTQGDPSQFHTDIVFQTNFRSQIAVAKLDTDKFAVCVIDDADDDGNVRATNVTGTSIDGYGAEDEFTTTDDEGVTCAGVATDEIIAIYNDEGGGDTGDISACTFDASAEGTCGTHSTFDSTGGEIRYTSIAKAGTNKAVYAYEEQISGDGFVGAGTNSGTTESAGAEIEFSSDDDVSAIAICSPAEYGGTADRFLIVARNSTDTSVDAWVGTLSGTDPTMGSETTITENAGKWSQCVFVSETVVFLIYGDEDDNEYLKSAFGTVDWSNRSVTFTTPKTIAETDVIHTDTPTQPSAQNLGLALISGFGTSPKVVVGYMDDNSTTDIGYVIIGNVFLGQQVISIGES